jgi:predicted dehydrogenase
MRGYADPSDESTRRDREIALDAINSEAGSTASSDPKLTASLGHTAQFRDFLLAIDRGTEPSVTASDGRATIEVIFGVYEAARRGQTVSPIGV